MLDSSGGMCCYSGCTGEWVFFGGRKWCTYLHFLIPLTSILINST
jgi:hypothetical protein